MSMDEIGTLPPRDLDLIDVNTSYGFKQEGLEFKDIVIRAIEKCRIEGSKEMTKGGQTTIFSKELNAWMPINIPDQRKIYQQSIEQLHNLLIFYLDVDAIKRISAIRLKLQNAYSIVLKEYLEKENWIPYKQNAMRTGVIQSGKDSSIGLFFIDKYESEILNLYNSFYQELVLLFKRKKDLSMKRGSSDRDK